MRSDFFIVKFLIFHLRAKSECGTDFVREQILVDDQLDDIVRVLLDHRLALDLVVGEVDANFLQSLGNLKRINRLKTRHRAQ